MGNYTYNMTMAIACESKSKLQSDERMRKFWKNASIGFAKRAFMCLRKEV